MSEWKRVMRVTFFRSGDVRSLERIEREPQTMIEQNKMTRAESLIHAYCDGWLIQLYSLTGDDVDVAYNLPHHDLSHDELVTLLCQMFESGDLVAMTTQRGYFTPTLADIEAGLAQQTCDGSRQEKDVIRFGATGAASLRIKQLKEAFPEYWKPHIEQD
jgi:hypothetical protein